MPMTEVLQGSGGNSQPDEHAVKQHIDLHDERPDSEEDSDGDNKTHVEENIEGDITKLTGRQKKLFELRLKMVSVS